MDEKAHERPVGEPQSADEPEPGASGDADWLEISAAVDEPPRAARSRLDKRRRTVLGVGIAAALLSVAGLAAGMLVKSPAQVAADARAPEASVITAEVVSERLSNTVVLRGDFTSGPPVSVTPTSVATTASLYGGTNAGGGTPILTRVMVRTGQEVRAAVPIADVSGRPVFVLPGKAPAYADMRPGESGNHIAQLQSALRTLGLYDGGDPRGYFGAATKRAVTGLYERMKYPVPITGPDTAQAARQARSTVDKLRRQLTGTGQGGASQEGGAEEGGTGGADTGGAGAAPQQSDQLKQQLTAAEKALRLAEAQDGPMVPLSEMAFVPELPARVTALPAVIGAKVAGPVVSLSTGGLRLTGYLDQTRGGLVEPGMKVEIVSEALGVSATGKVTSVGALVTPGDTAGGAKKDDAGQDAPPSATVNGGVPYLPLTLTSDRPWDTRFDGQNVRITIAAAATSGEVLTVPEAAVVSGADAVVTVTVQRRDGSQQRVAVEAGVSADGKVQVSPVEPEQLRAGDRVVIGQ